MHNRLERYPAKIAIASPSLGKRLSLMYFTISYQELIYKNWQEGLMGNKVRIRINTEYSYTEIAS